MMMMMDEASDSKKKRQIKIDVVILKVELRLVSFLICQVGFEEDPLHQPEELT